ncbi:FixH family protein [Sphingomonas quercus]|uniref:FixH family protein n=1 Tax=Sphingomonas quercus TaxID=2842451 RepID=A0ABS6BM18_9SPHN|nr:FixH family protein [Sphingomonas quercus]MBU3079364.1 FixH family protein [Sphingomonas quercus]
MTGGFKGRHMLFAMIGFFGVVIAVNMVMAVLAARSFGGTIVDNSYVASQAFNRWLDEAGRQKSLGWRAGISRVGAYAEIRLDIAGRPLDGARVTAVAEHPLGRLPDRPLRFRGTGAGAYRSVEPLPGGRWRLRVEVRRGAQVARFIEDVGA